MKKRWGFDLSGSCLRWEGIRIFGKREEKGKGWKLQWKERERERERERVLLSRVSSCEEVTVNTRQGRWGCGSYTPTLLRFQFVFFFQVANQISYPKAKGKGVS